MEGQPFVPVDHDARELAFHLKPFGLHQGDDAVQQRRRDDLAEADRLHQLFAAVDAVFLQKLRLHRRGQLGEVDVLFLRDGPERRFAEALRFGRLAVAQVLADFRARASRADRLEPLRHRVRVGPRFDLNHVAVLERRDERLLLSVDAGGEGVVADVRVNFVGEVDRGRPLWQRNDLSARREDVDAVREEVDLDVFKKFGAVLTGALNFEKILEPGGRAGLQSPFVDVRAVEPVDAGSGSRSTSEWR